LKERKGGKEMRATRLAVWHAKGQGFKTALRNHIQSPNNGSLVI
jgi:hypothetical protein